MDKKILIVDDVEINRILLYKIFEEKYEVLQAEDGYSALEIINREKSNLSAVLLDVIMPGMDGFDVLDNMRMSGLIKLIPVVLITGDASIQKQYMGYDKGAVEVINKPFDAYLTRRRVDNIVDLYAYKNSLEHMLDDKVKEIQKRNEDLYELNKRVINTMATITEFRDAESGEHIQRVREFTGILVDAVASKYPEYNLTPEKRRLIMEASVLHDVGKIAIPDSILLKPGKLTPDEFEIMKCHSEKGVDILERVCPVANPEYEKICKEIVHYHHEKYDGKGYPDGLKGDEIPISAQIVSLTDAFDALVSERVYKRAYCADEAYRMILDGECGIFNPKIIDCFQEVFPVLKQKAAEMM